MKLALVGARVLDGQGQLSPEGRVVVLVDGEIAGIDDRLEATADMVVVDVSGDTLMPGIIDSHVHYAPWAQWLVAHPDDRLMNMACQTVDALRRSVEAGVTTARDLGGLESGFVEAAEGGLITAPRLQTCVTIIQPTNGLLDNMPGMGGVTSRWGTSLQLPGMPSPYCAGPWAAREKVREVARCGANVIKIATSSQFVNGTMQWDLQTFHEEEIAAICDEAHRMGLKVTAHARGLQGVIAAIHHGVDGVEHGGDLNDEVLGEMARRGIWLIPTLFIPAWHVEHDPKEIDRANARSRFELTARTLVRAHQLGVPIALGSDGGLHDPASGIKEMRFMSDAGMPTRDVLVAATSGAAKWLGVDDRVGSVAVGKLADLVIVSGDPVADPAVIEHHLSLVLLNGAVVGGRRRHEVLDALSSDSSAGSANGTGVVGGLADVAAN